MLSLVELLREGRFFYSLLRQSLQDLRGSHLVYVLFHRQRAFGQAPKGWQARAQGSTVPPHGGPPLVASVHLPLAPAC